MSAGREDWLDTNPVRVSPAFGDLLSREWLVTNGLGGYASSTVAGLNTRKYHGLLVAAMSPPTRRMVMLSRVEETISTTKRDWPLACCEYPGAIFPAGHEQLRAFSAGDRPRWAYQGDGWTIDKELFLQPGSNTVLLTYTLLTGDGPVELSVRPLLALRGIHELSFQWNGRLEATPFEFAIDPPEDGARGRLKSKASCLRVAPTSRTPELFLAHGGDVAGKFESRPDWYLNTIYRQERERGYAGLEDVWSPGFVKFTLRPGQRASFACSVEPIEIRKLIADANESAKGSAKGSSPHAMQSAPGTMSIDTSADVAPSAHTAAVSTAVSTWTKRPEETLAWLQSAAQQFLPAVNIDAEDASGIHSAPPFFATAYPWSSPSVRDALIAYTGLFLLTDRSADGLRFLEATGQTLRDGLIATHFPEDGTAATYEGADTSLWFINAVYAHARYTTDGLPSEAMFRLCARIVETYRAGTELGIRVGDDGLIASRSSGIGTSWMDAKLGDWVITPRQGRPVELNALWYNALRIVAAWCPQFDQPMRGDDLMLLADRLRAAFNRTFWHDHAGCCYDVVGDNVSDPSIRPNQLFAISLPFAVLDESRHRAVLETIRSRLLTPNGLRTLAPEDPSYQPRYLGDVVSRDRAYHQGSAYPWLLGPYVSALTRALGRTPESLLAARAVLSESIATIASGSPLCELFDGDLPQEPRGAIASALSIAELLRCYCEDVLGLDPQRRSTPPKQDDANVRSAM